MVDPVEQAGPDRLLHRWRPSRTAHCVVLIGAYGDQGHVVIHDPWRGPRLSMSTDSFNEVLRHYTWPVKVGATRLTTRGAAWAS